MSLLNNFSCVAAKEGLEVAFMLLDFQQPTAVQHFAACIFYDHVREKWEDWTTDEELVSYYKIVL